MAAGAETTSDKCWLGYITSTRRWSSKVNNTALATAPAQDMAFGSAVHGGGSFQHEGKISMAHLLRIDTRMIFPPPSDPDPPPSPPGGPRPPIPPGPDPPPSPPHSYDWHGSCQFAMDDWEDIVWGASDCQPDYVTPGIPFYSMCVIRECHPESKTYR